MKSRYFVGFILMFILLASGLGLGQMKGDPKAGKVKYEANCVGCHGKTGKGDGPAAGVLNPKPQDYTDGKIMNVLSDKFLFDIIKDGGASLKKSAMMPASGKKLNDQEIWDIVAYIRSLANPPYKPGK